MERAGSSDTPSVGSTDGGFYESEESEGSGDTQDGQQGHKDHVQDLQEAHLQRPPGGLGRCNGSMMQREGESGAVMAAARCLARSGRWIL